MLVFSPKIYFLIVSVFLFFQQGCFTMFQIEDIYLHKDNLLPFRIIFTGSDSYKLKFFILLETKVLKKYLPKKSRQNINWCSCSRNPDLRCPILKTSLLYEYTVHRPKLQIFRIRKSVAVWVDRCSMGCCSLGRCTV